MVPFAISSILLFTLPVFVDAYLDEVVDFHEYSVLAAVPKTEEQVTFLRDFLENKGDYYKAEFWNIPFKNRRVSIGVPEESRENLLSILKENAIEVSTQIEELQKLIDNELAENGFQFLSSMNISRFDLGRYHKFEEIESFLKNLAQEYFYLAKVLILGRTAEDREILCVRIGLRCKSDDKPVILIDAGIHGREWISTATALYIINELVQIRPFSKEWKFLENFCWYIVPVVNPDGYAYTRTNRLWRKNRSTFGPERDTCVGADLNRNFQIGFGGSRSSPSPCKNNYHGPSAFSEKESQALKKLTEDHQKSVRLILSFHSFSQLWMMPYANTKGRPANYDIMFNASETATRIIESVHGMTYSVGTIAEMIGVAGGASIDWQCKLTKAPLCYAVELRDKGAEGFLLHKSQIIPTGEEIWEGIKILVNNYVVM